MSRIEELKWCIGLMEVHTVLDRARIPTMSSRPSCFLSGLFKVVFCDCIGEGVHIYINIIIINNQIKYFYMPYE